MTRPGGSESPPRFITNEATGRDAATDVPSSIFHHVQRCFNFRDPSQSDSLAPASILIIFTIVTQSASSSVEYPLNLIPTNHPLTFVQLFFAHHHSSTSHASAIRPN